MSASNISRVDTPSLKYRAPMKRRLLAEVSPSESLTPLFFKKITTPLDGSSILQRPVTNLTGKTQNLPMGFSQVFGSFSKDTVLKPDCSQLILPEWNTESSNLQSSSSQNISRPPPTPAKKKRKHQEALPKNFHLKIFYSDQAWVEGCQVLGAGDFYVVYKYFHPELKQFIVRKTPRQYSPKGRKYSKKEIDSILNCSEAQYARLCNKDLSIAQILNYDPKAPGKLSKDGYIEMEIYPSKLNADHFNNPKILKEIKSLIEYPFLVDHRERLDLKPMNILLKDGKPFLIDFLEVPPNEFDGREEILGQFVRLLLEKGVTKDIIEKLIMRLPKIVKSNIQEHILPK